MSKPTIRLLNVIVAFDVYCVAGSEATSDANAINAVMELIRSGEINASHFKALELRASPVRPQWTDQHPIVACCVSDADFEKLKGKTTQEVYDLLTKHLHGR